jgi:hypothetical protein
MKTEFFLDLIFVQEKVIQEVFADAVKKQMKALFSDKGKWHIAVKEEGLVVIIAAEINGIYSWHNEEMVFDDLEKEASPQFWEWLQGYHIRFDVKEYAECSHCGRE